MALIFGFIVIFTAQGTGCALGGASDEQGPDRQPMVEVRRFEMAKDEGVLCVTFFPDGNHFAAGTNKGRLQLWDMHKLESSQNFKVASGDLLTSGILCLAVSGDSKKILVGCADNSVRLWDVPLKKVILNLQGHAGPVWAVTFFKTGEHALSGSTSDFTIREWDLENGKEIRLFNGGERPDSLSLSPSERSFATTNFGTVELWDLESRKKVRSFGGRDWRLAGTFFSPDGQQIIAVDTGGLIKVWDASTGNLVKEFGDSKMLVQSVAISSDGRRILLGKTGEMQLWDVETGTILDRVDGMRGRVCVAFSPNGQYAITGEMLGGVRLWRTAALPSDSSF